MEDQSLPGHKTPADALMTGTIAILYPSLGMIDHHHRTLHDSLQLGDDQIDANDGKGKTQKSYIPIAVDDIDVVNGGAVSFASLKASALATHPAISTSRCEAERRKGWFYIV